MENIIIFDKIQTELKAIIDDEKLISELKVKLEDILWLFDFAKAHYKNDTELARLKGKNDALKELIGESKQPKQEELDETSSRIRKILKQKLIDFKLDVRTNNVLDCAGITTLGELVSRQKKDIKKFRNAGAKTMDILQDLVDSQGLIFGMNVEKYKLNEN